MSEDAQPLEALSQELAGLQDLFLRRLSEDKNTKQLVRSVEQSLQARDELDTGKAFAPLFKELLLALDRLQANEPSVELNHSIADEILNLLSRYGLGAIDTSGLVDTRIHEVVGVQDADEGKDGSEKDADHAEGSICTVVRSGYTLGDSVLRPAQVTIWSSRGSSSADIAAQPPSFQPTSN